MISPHILPLASKKLLAMYYYENLPISGIAGCFNLPACRIYEILRQTVGLLGNDLLKVISRKCHFKGPAITAGRDSPDDKFSTSHFLIDAKTGEASNRLVAQDP